jgi:hypothetical protein
MSKLYSTSFTVVFVEIIKERLVLDLRHVNKFVDKQKIKFEGVNEALAFVNTSKYMYKFDLKSGTFFHKVRNFLLFPNHRQDKLQ